MLDLESKLSEGNQLPKTTYDCFSETLRVAKSMNTKSKSVVDPAWNKRGVGDIVLMWRGFPLVDEMCQSYLVVTIV